MLKHGEFVSPTVVALGGASAPNEVDDQTLNGVLKRFGKKKRASDEASPLNNVTAVFEDAIAFQQAGMSAQLRGVGLMCGGLGFGILIWMVPSMIGAVVDEFRQGSFGFLRVWSVLGYGLLFWLTLFVFPRPLYVCLKFDLFAPADLPTVFDRRNRKVYRLLPPFDGSANRWSERLKPIILQAVEYDWNFITAEHRVTMTYTGQTVSRSHNLVMVVRDRPKSREKEGRLLDEFDVGSGLTMGENTVPILWEHIRRFMEEDGPGVPKGENLQIFERPRNLWQSMGVVSPFGPKFGWWWRLSPFVALALTVPFPLTFPFFTLWAICNWISHMTMRKTLWPEEILRRVGKPVRSAEPVLFESVKSA